MSLQGGWQCGMGGATDRASHWPAACMTFSRHCWSPLKVLSSVAAPGMARTCVQFASVSVCHSTTGFLCTQCKQAGQRRLCTSASVAGGRGADRSSGRPPGQGGRGRADQDGGARVGRLQHPVQRGHVRLHRHAADVRQGRRRVHLRGRPEGARGLARGSPGTARVAMRQAARVWASCGAAQQPALAHCHVPRQTRVRCCLCRTGLQRQVFRADLDLHSEAVHRGRRSLGPAASSALAGPAAPKALAVLATLAAHWMELAQWNGGRSELLVVSLSACSIRRARSARMRSRSPRCTYILKQLPASDGRAPPGSAGEAGHPGRGGRGRRGRRDDDPAQAHRHAGGGRRRDAHAGLALRHVHHWPGARRIRVGWCRPSGDAGRRAVHTCRLVWSQWCAVLQPCAAQDTGRRCMLTGRAMPARACSCCCPCCSSTLFFTQAVIVS